MPQRKREKKGISGIYVKNNLEDFEFRLKEHNIWKIKFQSQAYIKKNPVFYRQDNVYKH